MYRLKKLTRARVEQWLRENKDIYFAGSHASECPIVRYLTEMYNTKHTIMVPLVGSRQVQIWRNDYWQMVETPHWVVKFIETVDAKYKPGMLINGRDALAILQGI